MNHDQPWLTCSCCGAFVANDASENASHGESPYPHDKGYGMCLSCGGDPNAEDVKDRMGFAKRVFFEARFDTIRKNLRPANQADWDERDYETKCSLVVAAVEKGLII